MPQALLVQALVTQLRVTLEAIGSFERAIAERAQNHFDFPLFEALLGAGVALAPRLLVAFGKQRERYGSAAEVQTYAGIAPVMERSGAPVSYAAVAPIPHGLSVWQDERRCAVAGHVCLKRASRRGASDKTPMADQLNGVR